MPILQLVFVVPVIAAHFPYFSLAAPSGGDAARSNDCGYRVEFAR